ncbi:MAG: DUF4062 domain-containing protein, partial [Candidatus Alcyoniella australis]|nr:DUF4062 domain-containing protein [Candidatus Alcyoniella australis]
MRRKWQTVRVFISSTFRDMQAERDYLVRSVFPGLREKLERHRIYFVDIDLRWGVTKQDADNDQVLGLCLQLIDESRPFFIGLLGERYGWVPKSHPAEALAKYGWIKDAELCEHSVTALEIVHGVLRDPKMESLAFFYFRDPAFLKKVPEPLRSEVFVDAAPDLRKKLDALKREIADHHLPLFDRYPCQWNPAHENPDGTHGRVEGLKEFGEQVEKDLWEGCCRKFDWLEEEEREFQAAGAKVDEPLPQGEEWLDDERDFHERFIESRLRVFVGREKLLADLASYLKSDSPKPLLLTGPSGCGKSAILGKLYLDSVKGKGYALDVPHFVGASPGSTSLYTTLRRFCLELQRAFNIEDLIPSDPNKLPMTFQEFLKKIPDGKKAVFLIDAVNQFDAWSQADNLHWLPAELPPGVRVVLSTIDDGAEPSITTQEARRRDWEIKQVEPLTIDDRREIVRLIPSLAAKRLDNDQVKLLLDNPATDNPLYLAVSLEELRGFGSFERLNERIKAFPSEGLDDLFDQVLDQVEREFDRQVVRKAMSLVAVSRNGLSEAELKELVAGLDKDEDLFPMLRRLRPYLLKRGPYVDFYHRNLFKAVRARYLPDETDAQAAHKELANYFFDKGNPDKDNPWQGAPKRTVSELPHHLMAVRQEAQWKRLGQTLCDLGFIEAKVNHGMVYDLVRDFIDAEKRVPTSGLLGPDWTEWKQFVESEAGTIDRYSKDFPQLAFQQAYNQPKKGVVSRVAQSRLDQGKAPQAHWLERVNRPEEFERSACLKV